MASSYLRFTLEERQALAHRISALDDPLLRFILKLVRSLEPRAVQTAGEEYEFDIAQLSPATIRAVQAQLDVWAQKQDKGARDAAAAAAAVAVADAASSAYADGDVGARNRDTLPPTRRGKKRGHTNSVRWGDGAAGAGGGAGAGAPAAVLSRSSASSGTGSAGKAHLLGSGSGASSGSSWTSALLHARGSSDGSSASSGSWLRRRTGEGLKGASADPLDSPLGLSGVMSFGGTSIGSLGTVDGASVGAAASAAAAGGAPPEARLSGSLTDLLGKLDVPAAARRSGSLSLPMPTSSELAAYEMELPAVGFERAAAEAKPVWTCPSCTFDNDMANQQCWICTASKPAQGSSTRRTAGPFKAVVSVFEAKHKTPDGMWTCEHCGRKFKTRSDLVPHVRTHTGEKPFVCNWIGCDSRFAHSSNLRAHERSHRGVKRYKCDKCSKAFAHPTSLRDHKMSHLGIRPYKCDWEDCGATFTAVANMKRHRKLHDKHHGLLPRQRKKRAREAAAAAKAAAAAARGGSTGRAAAKPSAAKRKRTSAA